MDQKLCGLSGLFIIVALSTVSSTLNDGRNTMPWTYCEASLTGGQLLGVAGVPAVGRLSWGFSRGVQGGGYKSNWTLTKDYSDDGE